MIAAVTPMHDAEEPGEASISLVPLGTSFYLQAWPCW